MRPICSQLPAPQPASQRPRTARDNLTAPADTANTRLDLYLHHHFVGSSQHATDVLYYRTGNLKPGPHRY